MNARPLLLDLFCGAGGAAMGYHRTGFDVVGVDIAPQPHYPFTFVQDDALSFLAAHYSEYDAIHASPPCQKFMTLQNVNRARGFHVDHPDLIADTRRALESTGKPYIIENVQGSPLLTQVVLCGHALGLTKLARHRHFESNLLLFGLPCAHRRKEVIGVYGNYPDGRAVMKRKEFKVTYAASSIDEGRAAMGIEWMDWDELTEAIPPAYTEFIGKQLMQAIRS